MHATCYLVLFAIHLVVAGSAFAACALTQALCAVFAALVYAALASG